MYNTPSQKLSLDVNCELSSSHSFFLKEASKMLFATAQVLVLAVLFSLHNVLAQTLADPLNLNASIKEVKVE